MISKENMKAIDMVEKIESHTEIRERLKYLLTQSDVGGVIICNGQISVGKLNAMGQIDSKVLMDCEGVTESDLYDFAKQILNEVQGYEQNDVSVIIDFSDSRMQIILPPFSDKVSIYIINKIKDKESKIIKRAEDFACRYKEIIGHENAEIIMDLVRLAKMQEIELKEYKGLEK